MPHINMHLLKLQAGWRDWVSIDIEGLLWRAVDIRPRFTIGNPIYYRAWAHVGSYDYVHSTDWRRNGLICRLEKPSRISRKGEN
jgi:hypothetical protein